MKKLTAEGLEQRTLKRLGQKEYQSAKFGTVEYQGKYFGTVNGYRTAKSFVSKDAARNYAIDFAYKYFVQDGNTKLAAGVGDGVARLAYDDPYAKQARAAASDLKTACESAARQVAQKYGAKVLATSVDAGSTEASVTVGVHWD